MDLGSVHTTILSPSLILKSPRAIIPLPSLITPPTTAVRGKLMSTILLLVTFEFAFTTNQVIQHSYC